MNIEIQLLMKHLEWADATLLAAILQAPAYATDGRIRELLYHAQSVEQIYLQFWRKQPVEIPEQSEVPGTHAIAVGMYRFHEECRKHVLPPDETELGRVIDFPWKDMLQKSFGEIRPTTVRESILQIVIHSAYHRGQINSRLRELGSSPPLVDFVAWIWAGKPEADWNCVVHGPDPTINQHDSTGRGLA
jgi:uncharacterized damage-inducible protein DinB